MTPKPHLFKQLTGAVVGGTLALALYSGYSVASDTMLARVGFYTNDDATKSHFANRSLTEDSDYAYERQAQKNAEVAEAFARRMGMGTPLEEIGQQVREDLESDTANEARGMPAYHRFQKVDLPRERTGGIQKVGFNPTRTYTNQQHRFPSDPARAGDGAEGDPSQQEHPFPGAEGEEESKTIANVYRPWMTNAESMREHEYQRRLDRIREMQLRGEQPDVTYYPGHDLSHLSHTGPGAVLVGLLAMVGAGWRMRKRRG